jgi:DNA-binding transcriptional MerR regulator
MTGYSIGDVAVLTGLSQHTLRWYERIGLMSYIERDHSGQRRFTDQDLGWLDLINRLRSTGMAVADMVRYAELVRMGESTFPERLSMFEKTREETLAKIAELQEAVAVLDKKIEIYSGKVRDHEGVKAS